MVKDKQKQSGISLTEILVVMAIMAVLMGVSIPAAKQLMNSFESSTGTRQLINAALSNARAIAVRNQTYAGVRFQEDINGNTYIIFIQHDKDATGLANGFRAVMGRKPMKLPEDVGVLEDRFIRNEPAAETTNNALVDTAVKLSELSTFSIVFSSQGKLTVHPVRVNNKDGVSSNDTIFNTVAIVDAGDAMFYQDNSNESSIKSFLIYIKPDLKAVVANARWTNYFSALKPEYISPYTGELVMEYREQKP